MGRFEMEDIMAAPGLDNLHIIEAGPIPANPSELLSTSALGQFLREVSAEYDIVLIDTPPVLPVTDSAIVAAQADGVLLVYQAGKVGRLVLKRAKAHLESTRAKVWGVVLNDVQTEVSGYTYTHYYTHYYGEETPSPRDGGALHRAWDAVRSRLGRRPSGAAPIPVTARRGSAAGSRAAAAIATCSSASSFSAGCSASSRRWRPGRWARCAAPSVRSRRCASGSASAPRRRRVRPRPLSRRYPGRRPSPRRRRRRPPRPPR